MIDMTPTERAAVSIQNESETVSSLSTMRTAMQQALEALEHKRSCAYKRIDQNPSECTCGVTKALTALREALAKEDSLPDDCEWIDGATPPEGERMRIQANGETWFVKNGRYYRCTAEHKQELTKSDNAVSFDIEQEPVAKYSDIVSDGGLDPRNAAPMQQAQQEPVAWMDENGWASIYKDELYTRPLYAAPVRTKDLTDAFINELHKDAQDPISFARAVIAADREKNK